MTYADSDYLEAVIAAGPDERNRLIANKRAEIQVQIDHYNKIAKAQREARKAWWEKNVWSRLGQVLRPIEWFFDSVFSVFEFIGNALEGIVVLLSQRVKKIFTQKEKP